MAKQVKVGKNEALVGLTVELNIIVRDNGEEDDQLVEKAGGAIKEFLAPIANIKVADFDGEVVPEDWWEE